MLYYALEYVLFVLFQAIEAAMQKIKEADKMQSKASAISSSMDFLTRVYISSKDGDSYGINVSNFIHVHNLYAKKCMYYNTTSGYYMRDSTCISYMYVVHIHVRCFLACYMQRAYVVMFGTSN